MIARKLIERATGKKPTPTETARAAEKIREANVEKDPTKLMPGEEIRIPPLLP